MNMPAEQSKGSAFLFVFEGASTPEAWPQQQPGAYGAVHPAKLRAELVVLGGFTATIHLTAAATTTSPPKYNHNRAATC